MKIQKLKKVELNELGLIIKLIRLDYPDVTEREQISKIIKEEYSINCSIRDLLRWEEPCADELEAHYRRIYSFL